MTKSSTLQPEKFRPVIVYDEATYLNEELWDLAMELTIDDAYMVAIYAPIDSEESK